MTLTQPSMTMSHASGGNGWRMSSGLPHCTARSTGGAGPGRPRARRSGVRAPSTRWTGRPPAPAPRRDATAAVAVRRRAGVLRLSAVRLGADVVLFVERATAHSSLRPGSAFSAFGGKWMLLPSSLSILHRHIRRRAFTFPRPFETTLARRMPSGDNGCLPPLGTVFIACGFAQRVGHGGTALAHRLLPADCGVPRRLMLH